MKDNKLISAIVVAAGKGTRMGTNIKKQFIMLDKKPIILYSINEFCKNDFIDEIVLVTSKEDISYCKDLIKEEGLKKRITIVEGGKTRQESVFCGLKSVSPNTDIVLVHDGARPFIKNLDLGKLIQEAIRYGSATFGVLSKDTIKIKNDSMEILETLDRSKLVAIQTPQAFEYKKLFLAHKEAQRKNYVGTDDTVLLDRCNITTKVVEGNYYNIKITTKEDLDFASIIKQKLQIN